MANQQHLDKPTAGGGASAAGGGPRGSSLDQAMRNTHGNMGMGPGKHGNIMMLNKSHNDGKGLVHTGPVSGHQRTQSQAYAQQQPGALLSNFTKGANLPQHPNSTTNNCKYTAEGLQHLFCSSMIILMALKRANSLTI